MENIGAPYWGPLHLSLAPGLEEPENNKSSLTPPRGQRICDIQFGVAYIKNNNANICYCVIISSLFMLLYC